VEGGEKSEEAKREKWCINRDGGGGIKVERREVGEGREKKTS